MEKILSCFIDEAGDFGKLDKTCPFYYVAIVFHNQGVDISKDIAALNERTSYWGYPIHAIHTGPLIRREGFYAEDEREKRRSLFNALFDNVEYRRVKPVDYKLFRVADLMCTMELIKEKADKNILSKSEENFFGKPRDFKKNIYKYLDSKKLKH